MMSLGLPPSPWTPHIHRQRLGINSFLQRKFICGGMQGTFPRTKSKFCNVNQGEDEKMLSKGIKEILDRQVRDGADPEEFSVSVWELLERVPSTNKVFLESMKPYPSRLPSVQELFNILSEENADLTLEALGIEKSMGDFIFETMTLALSVWILEPLVLYCWLSVTKSEAAHPLLFSASNLVGNFTSILVLSSSKELAEVIIASLSRIVSKFRNDLMIAEVEVNPEPILQGLGNVGIILVSQLLITQGLLGFTLSDSLEISAGLFVGWVFGIASLFALIIYEATP